MLLHTRTLKYVAALGAVLWSASAHAAPDPSGIWYDHNGRGAVEIAPCASGKGMCGYVVHIKDSKNNKRCGTQILGNVTPEGGGWIYSPDRGKKYSVELTRLSDEKLRVVGNAGSFFSKTYTWKRAPDDVARCGETTAAAPATTDETAAAPQSAKKKTTTAAAAPSESTKKRALSTGNGNGSLALIANTGVKTAAATATEEPAAAEEPAPAATEGAPAKAEPAKAEPAAAAEPETTTAESEPAAEEEFVPERKCKFKIPYVGRVIDVPCRD